MRSFPALLAAAVFAFTTAAAEVPSTIRAQVTGKGSPMILIPGLSSSPKVWDSTVAHYKDRFECHVLSIAGFAGEPATRKTPFIESVRDDVAAYIRSKNLGKPLIVGHSLGGFIGLSLASKYPELVGRMVILDSLPFMAGIMDPTMTVERAKPVAEMLRKRYTSSVTPEQREKASELSLRLMVIRDSDLKTLTAWTKASDPATIGNATAEMYTTDLRPQLGNIKVPVLVLGTWIAYSEYQPRQFVEEAYRKQYANLKGVKIVFTDTSRHFIMMDDPDWMFAQMDSFLGVKK